MLLDLAKGFAAVAIAATWGEDAALVAAGGAVIGHMFPIWLGLRGGKARATALGVVFGALAWPVALGAALVWLAAVFLFRYSSLAALIATVVGAALAPFVTDEMTAAVIAGIALLIILRHHANIPRPIAGTESRISLTKG